MISSWQKIRLASFLEARGQKIKIRKGRKRVRQSSASKRSVFVPTDPGQFLEVQPGDLVRQEPPAGNGAPNTGFPVSPQDSLAAPSGSGGT